MTLEFRADAAPPHQNPSYGGKLREKLFLDGVWIGTIWQHVTGHSWVLIEPGIGITASGECSGYDDGRRLLLDAYHNIAPSWDDVRGIAPNATGDLSSEDWVRQQRDEWDTAATVKQGEE